MQEVSSKRRCLVGRWTQKFQKVLEMELCKFLPHRDDTESPEPGELPGTPQVRRHNERGRGEMQQRWGSMPESWWGPSTCQGGAVAGSICPVLLLLVKDSDLQNAHWVWQGGLARVACVRGCV